MEMVNSHPPHHRSALKAMFVAATEGYTDPIEEKDMWSQEIRDFIGRSVIKNPKERWTVDQLLGHEFVGKKTDREEMSKLFTKIFSH
jgi:serine/threonine protein kinase